MFIELGWSSLCKTLQVEIWEVGPNVGSLTTREWKFHQEIRVSWQGKWTCGMDLRSYADRVVLPRVFDSANPKSSISSDLQLYTLLSAQYSLCTTFCCSEPGNKDRRFKKTKRKYLRVDCHSPWITRVTMTYVEAVVHRPSSDIFELE